MKKKLLIIQVILITFCSLAKGQPGNTGNVQVYIEGNSSGIIDNYSEWTIDNHTK